MTKLTVLNRLGHSIWHDNIRRALVDSGELLTLIDRRVTGVASNPSIFEKAIDGSPDYDEAIADMAYPYQSAEAIYEVLTFEEIRQTAYLLRPIYDQTQIADGFISLGLAPRWRTIPKAQLPRRVVFLLRWIGRMR